MNNQKNNTAGNIKNNKPVSSNAPASNIKNKLGNVVDAGKSNPVVAIVVVLILLVVLYFSAKWVWDRYKATAKARVTTKTLLGGSHNGSVSYDVGTDEMAASSYSNEYGLSFWVYVDDYNYRQGQRKFILRRGSIRTGANPEIYLHPNDNRLRINISMMTSNTEPTAAATAAATAAPTATSPVPTTTNRSGFTDYQQHREATTCDCDITSTESVLTAIASNNPNVPPEYDPSYFEMVSGNEVPTAEREKAPLAILSKEAFTNPPSCDCPPADAGLETDSARAEFEASAGHCIVDDFPLQKWTHVVVSQYNQVVDVYIDGKLRSSCVMPGFPKIVQDDLVIAPDGGFGGLISKVQYINSVMTAMDVHDLYMDGPEDKGAGFISSVPNWVWWLIGIIIIGAVAYSFMH